MDLPDVYNAVVWTESALRYLSTAPRFAEVARRLHASTRTQIVLAPGTQSSEEVISIFGSVPPPTVVLALDTSPVDEATSGFPYYCAQSLSEGIQLIHSKVKERFRKPFLGKLGALVPLPELSIEDAQELRPKDTGGVLWFAVETQGHIFIGPALPALAEQILIHYGVDAERTLWLCSLPPVSPTSSVDFGVLLRRTASKKIRPVHVGSVKVPLEVQNWLIRTPFIERAGEDTAAQAEDLSKALLFQPVRLHPDCSLLRSKKIFAHLKECRHQGDVNRQTALSQLRLWYEKTDLEPETAWLRAASERLAEDGFIFDNKSGAISFDSYEWETDISRTSEDNWRHVVAYFQGRTEEQWQSDRPNLARRLETPTKTILRGEDYYINMANIPPTARIKRIAGNFTGLFDICDLRTLFQSWDQRWKWKLTLGICDQLRNCALQINWFAYQLGRHPLIRSASATRSLLPLSATLTEAAVGLYYSTLVFDKQKAYEHLAVLTEKCSQELPEAVENSLEMIRKVAATTTGDMVFTGQFVRRWREADHPGENLLVALQALDFCATHEIPPPLAVGISWGGIELPLVFKHIWRARPMNTGQPLVLVADYSHYRREERGEEVPYIGLAPDSPAVPVRGSQTLIFDDNSLTGLTIERVHDDLLKHRCPVAAVFITRISGGRRYGQMRMKDHGVLNPDLIGSLVKGFVGETPFALTWSREEYTNPIGIFSLARRRILELLYANGSVERYDREGF